ncbi:MAG: hypothetical protein QOJ64_2106 [Acidobacteriota bacterium]|jgi:hypothetical protein|nr:hypothetical protein [Acidobacteriota bacterium]
MRKLTILIILIAAATVVSAQEMPMPMPVQKTAGSQSDAQKAFEKLKTLAGSWQGSVMGMSIQATIRVTSRGNAILHEVTSSAMPDNPITMIYVDGDRLLLTHYCDSGNRPRMEGKISPDGNSVEFTLVDITGNTEKGFMNRVAFTIVDTNHHNEESTWMLPGNKSFRAAGVLQRIK